MSSSNSFHDDQDIPQRMEDACFAQTDAPIYRDMGSVFASEMMQAQHAVFEGKVSLPYTAPSFPESSSLPFSLVSFSEYGKTNIMLEASSSASVELPTFDASDVYPLEATHLKICTSDVSLLMQMVESFLKENSNVISCDTCPSSSPFESTLTAGTWRCHSFHEKESCSTVIKLYEDKSNIISTPDKTVVVMEWQRRQGDVALFKSLFRKFQQNILADVLEADVMYSGPSVSLAVRPSVIGVPSYRTSQALPCTMPDCYKVTHSPVTTPDLSENVHAFTQWIAAEPNEALTAWNIFLCSAAPSSLLSIYTAVSLSLAHACFASKADPESAGVATATDRNLCLALQCLSDMHTSMTSVINSVDIAALRALQSKNDVLVDSLILEHPCGMVKSLATTVKNTLAPVTDIAI